MHTIKNSRKLQLAYVWLSVYKRQF